MSKVLEYPFEIRPLSKDDGGGFMIRYVDFSECVSDGETVEEAMQNGRLALKETIAALKAAGHKVPQPGVVSQASGKFVARVPRSVHASLTSRAQVEGVSLNTLVVSLLSQGLAARQSAA